MKYVSSNNGVQGHGGYGVHTLILGPGVARGTKSFSRWRLRIVVIAVRAMVRWGFVGDGNADSPLLRGV